MNTTDFQELVWRQGSGLYRPMPWRDNPTPYFVLVSELMLQQTQVVRVVPKFNAFIARFPDVSALAAASLSEVLILWSGLGYNRRAKYLHDAAKAIVADFDGRIPASLKELVTLPGVGPNTAGAILAYAFNQPVVFIETNIRTVYFYHFFADTDVVHDNDLRTIVKNTLDVSRPRQWYWALMDYGSFLKSSGAGRIDQSRHYKKQTPLKGSLGEVRGHIIRALTKIDMTEAELYIQINGDERFAPALTALIGERLITRHNGRLYLTK